MLFTHMSGTVSGCSRATCPQVTFRFEVGALVGDLRTVAIRWYSKVTDLVSNATANKVDFGFSRGIHNCGCSHIRPSKWHYCSSMKTDVIHRIVILLRSNKESFEQNQRADNKLNTQHFWSKFGWTRKPHKQMLVVVLKNKAKQDVQRLHSIKCDESIGSTRFKNRRCLLYAKNEWCWKTILIWFEITGYLQTINCAVFQN